MFRRYPHPRAAHPLCLRIGGKPEWLENLRPQRCRLLRVWTSTFLDRTWPNNIKYSAGTIDYRKTSLAKGAPSFWGGSGDAKLLCRVEGTEYRVSAHFEADAQGVSGHWCESSGPIACTIVQKVVADPVIVYISGGPPPTLDA